MKRILLLAAAFAVVLPSAAQFSADKIGFGIRAGTLGPGLDIAYTVKPKLNVRLSGSYLTYSHTEENFVDEDDITMDLAADATVGAIGILADFHPFGNFLRLTAGVNLNLFEVNAVGTPTSSVCFGDEDTAGVCDGKEFSPERLGTFGATVGYASSVAPYLGLGFGKVSGRKRIGFLFDLGALYAGAPNIDLQASGLLAPTPEANEDTLNQGVESFKWYPVVSLGFAVRL